MLLIGEHGKFVDDKLGLKSMQKILSAIKVFTSAFTIATVAFMRKKLWISFSLALAWL